MISLGSSLNTTLSSRNKWLAAMSVRAKNWKKYLPKLRAQGSENASAVDL
jgi:hypothetical protein